MDVLDQKKRPQGFSLVELILVVAVLSALAFVVVPQASSGNTSSKAKACGANVDMIERQTDKFFIDKGHWPANWDSFKDRPKYFAKEPPVCPFGTKYRFDPETYQVARHNHYPPNNDWHGQMTRSLSLRMRRLLLPE
jgi:competence protein ComGC